MFRRSLIRFSVFVAGSALALCALHATAQDNSSRRGRKFKTPPPASRIEVTVVRDANGKPIEHAAVIFHPIEGERDKGVMELKTNQEGKAVIDVIPIGDTVRLQIIAKGFQTYGEDFVNDKESQSMEIRMKRPGGQYSIYKQKNQAENSGNTPEKQATPPAGAPTQPKP